MPFFKRPNNRALELNRHSEEWHKTKKLAKKTGGLTRAQQKAMKKAPQRWADSRKN